MKLKKDSLVLLVDDFMLARHTLREALTNLGMTNFIEASNGAEAWEVLVRQQKQGHPIGMVTCDLNMPTMTGLELLAAVRENDAFKALPFFVVTVEADLNLIQRTLDLGATDYFVKPFSISEIQRKLEALIGKFAA